MGRRVVVAFAEREYASKLAEFVREQEPDWDVAAFTYAEALRRELHEGDRSIDLLIGEPPIMREAGASCERARKTLALVEQTGAGGDDGWTEAIKYQSLPGLLAAIRRAVAGQPGEKADGCRIVTVFSASGGTGKTTLALNLLRQAGERGLRTFYLNLEALNATSILFGQGEPDSLSRLLYGLRAHPEQWEDLFGKLCRHQPYIRADYIDAPEHPGERLAMTSDVLSGLVGRIRSSRRYDLIVVDPDQGASDWHRELMLLSDRVVWLAIDDVQGLKKADKLLRYWEEPPGSEAFTDKLLFVMNKAQGQRPINRWNLHGDQPAMSLPYVPQWKTVEQPGRLLGSPAFCGAVDELLELLDLRERSPTARRRKEAEIHGAYRSHVRGAG
ncbi:MAG: hypothetical protein J7559_15845 [Cohnella sp.]|nr:hypothetical protein [Cohnella sp.]